MRTQLPILLLASAFGVLAQTAPQNETFDINITEKRYVETNFARSTSATLQTEKLRFEAGTSVSAGSINMTVRGATGTVRFRARLDALERLFKTP